MISVSICALKSGKMDAQVDPKLLRSINSTKKLLGKHISKPVLADKYLGRPPFRFLLEIVNSVIQQTSFMKDIFSSNELKYDEISSAEDKRAVLKKVIEAIENETGEKCTARTSKILSGKEPDKTNEMLQLLAKAITSFSSKPKKKVEETKVSEKEKPVPVTIEDESKEKEESPTCNNDDNKEKEVRTEDEGSKKNKQANSRPSAGAVLVSKKSSTTTKAATTIKQRSSGDKLSLPAKSKASSVKASSSSPSTKVPSKEALKSKAGSPSTSSSALVPPKKASSTNLARSHSRQSLTVKLSTSSCKVPILPEPTKIPGKHQEGNVQKSESKDKLKGRSDDPQKLVTSAAAAMPPETTAEIPLQRPVTRTKYRQKANEGEESTDVTVGQDPPKISPPDHHKSIPHSGENEEDDSQPALEMDKKECGNCGVRSGRSTSSEDVVTEHMNQKISEWRVNSAEGVEHIKLKAVPSKGSIKTGWITNEEESCNTDGVNAPVMKKVFDSVENCSVEEGLDEQPGASTTVTTPKAPIIREDPSKKVWKRPITVLRDNESDDDEDDTFLVQERMESERDMALERIQQGALLLNAAGSSSASLDMTYLPPEHRGLLVNQIMETQRELEKLSGVSQHGSLLENELAERDKAAVREVYMRQIEDLKGAIQKMSKCANPLANIIQRSQDDACLMEIEFSKLKQENDRLQRKIDEAKCETSKMLYPLTEELAQLDGRIEKVEGAIVLAKQRLSLIDSEYAGEFIAQLANTPTEDETLLVPPELDPVWQFRGNFPPHEDDDDENGGIMKKSLMDVFKRAVNMHEGASWADGNDKNDRRVTAYHPISAKKTANITPKSEKRLLNRTVYGDDSPMGRRTNRILRQLEQEEPPVDKENKPSWWD